MNTNYFSSPINQYSTSCDYSYGYISPSTTTTSPSSYYYASMPSTSCPVHSPYNFYTTVPSMNVSPLSYSYYPQEQQTTVQSQTQVYDSSPVQSNTISAPSTDRTPLRRHKCFKKNELQLLHQAYNRDPHPSTDSLEHLATQLKAPVDKVRQWFKNRRHSQKLKKRDSQSKRSTTN